MYPKKWSHCKGLKLEMPKATPTLWNELKYNTSLEFHALELGLYPDISLQTPQNVCQRKAVSI